jgi:hypothetical protein
LCIVRVITKRKKAAERKPFYDEKDKAALRLMKKLRKVAILQIKPRPAIALLKNEAKVIAFPGQVRTFYPFKIQK